MLRLFFQYLSTRRAPLTLIGLFLITPGVTFAATNLSSIQDYLAAIATFLQNIILPFLFSFAFLYFLINLARLYVFEGASDSSHDQARNNAIWGIAAFVFLFSLWGIVTLVLNGLQINNNTAAACPDYITKFGGTCSETPATPFGSSQTFVSNTGGTNTYSGGANTYSGGANSYAGGSNSYAGGANAYPGSTITHPGLADLIFGNGKSGASFITNTGGPRALNNTPNIASTASCQSGLQTLELAAQTESVQAAYALIVSANGSVSWTNITDATGANGIGYDKDTFDSLLANQPKQVYIVTMHPESRTNNESLTMNGEGPTAGDLAAMCTSGHTNVTYVTVDHRGLWSVTPQADTCPYNATASAQLPIIETWNDLSMLAASTRNSELAKYVADSATPSSYQNYFAPYKAQDFGSMGPTAIRAFANDAETIASTTVTYTNNLAGFCSNL